MFGFLKKKIKGALDKFTKKVEEEAPEEVVEVKKEVVEEPKVEEVKETPKVEEVKEEVVEEKVEEVKKEKVEKVKEEKVKEEKVKEEKVEEVKEPVPEIKKEPKVEEVKEEIEEEIPELIEEPKVEEKKEVKVEEKPKEISKPKAEKKPEPKPEVKEKPKVEEKPKKKGFFSFITEKITTKKVSESQFEELFWDLELAMLENNVAVEVIEKIKADLKKELTENPVPRGKVEEVVINSLKNSISELFDVEQIDLLAKAKEKKPLVICFVGINGSGKTTSIAKVAHMFLQNNLSVVMAAADTFRAAAIDQLQLHADKLGVKLIKHDYGSDAAAVAFDAVKHAEAKMKDVVLIDTAGRLHSDQNLVEEMKKIVRVSKPDLIIFVGESITGNDCTEQAQKFDEAVGINGIILSKADVDEKGGAAISVSYVTKKPILYLGMGQEYPDLEPFDKEKLLASLF
ncbi:signal recognition particle-docking protein FtsY [Candidatus Woesearchaeota archaeon]|nr:signal recognition particle-docking protein FtsY [Candidatus Woesearchaeota archaeon]